MTRWTTLWIIAVAGVVTSMAVGQDEFAKRASWTMPSATDVNIQVLAWLDAQSLDEAVVQPARDLWSAEDQPATGVELLEQVVTTIALVDPAASPLIEICRGQAPSRAPNWTEVLLDEERSDFARNNLKLYFARWLAQHAYYDEAQEHLEGLNVDDVVDPASLLFYQSVVHHRLLNKDECLVALGRLMENEASIPRRYVMVAKLMESDIKPLETDSLDEVSRLMEDIQRRLHLGRAGTRVRDEEEDVIAKLDKMIEDLEKQRQQQQQASSGASGNLQPGQPAEDSMPLGGTGPGDVDQKRLENKGGWGNLPPKERQEALQQISKDLPAHFRDVIEEYFRKLARDGGN